jgi:8-oxo-dGTP diphosphatase/2-hydroxy-dATP diphosphatase
MVCNKVLTLAFIRRSGEILLGFKKRGFGAGRWNGFGGKVESGETVEQAAKRELFEECCIEVNSLRRIGLLMFEFVGDAQLLEVHVFDTDDFSGIATETDEMKPRWFSTSEIPFDTMWPDDRLWFPSLLAGRQFYGYFTFRGMDTIVSHQLLDVKDLDSVDTPQSPRTMILS